MSIEIRFFLFFSNRVIPTALSVVFFASFIFGTWFPAHAEEVGKTVELPRRHIIIGFDTSSSMGSKDRKGAVQRLPQLLKEILYSRIPRDIRSPDKGFPQINENSDLDFNSQLYRSGDIMTFFTFDSQNRYLFARKTNFIPLESFETIIPRSYPGKWSLLRCAEAEAFQNFQLQDEETFFIRITDEEEDLDIQEKEIYRDCVGRKIVYEADHFMKPKYVVLVGGKIFLTIYKIEGHVGPYPFFLVDSPTGDKMVQSIVFTKEGDRTTVRKGYGVVMNPKLKKTYTIQGVRLVVLSSDRGTVKFEKMLTNQKQRPPFNLNFDIDPKFLSRDYTIDFDIKFDRNAENPKAGPKIDDFSIRNIALKDDTPSDSPSVQVQQGNAFEIEKTSLDLESRRPNYFGGNISIKLASGFKAGSVRVDKVTLSGKGFSYSITPPTSQAFPLDMKIEFPSENFPEGENVPGVLSIESSSEGQSRPVQQINITFHSETPSFQVRCGQAGQDNALYFQERAGKVGLWDCRLALPDKFKPRLRTLDASLKVSGLTLPLGSFDPNEADLPLGKELTRSEWKKLSTGQAFSGTVTVDYGLTTSDRTFHSDVPVKVFIPKYPEAPSDPFIVTKSSESTTPEKEIVARWTNKGIILPDIYIKLRPDIAGEDAGSVLPLNYDTTGVCTRSGEIGSLPCKISLLPTPQEAEALAVGSANLKLTIRFSVSESGKETTQAYPIDVGIPKPPTPTFIVVSNQGDVAPASDVRLKRDGNIYKPEGLYLKLVKTVALRKIESVEYLAGGKKAGEWKNPAVVQDAVALPISFSEAPREDIPTSFKVTYSQLGSSEPLSTTLNGPKILPISWFSRRDHVGILPNVVLMILGLLLTLIGAFVAYILWMRLGNKSQPKRFQVRSQGMALWDEEKVSPILELKTGDTLGFTFEPQWTKMWAELNCPGWYIEYGKVEKALILRNVADPKRTLMKDFAEYEITDGTGTTKKISVYPLTERQKTAA